MLTTTRPSRGVSILGRRLLAFSSRNTFLLVISAASFFGFTLAFLVSTGSLFHSLAFGVRTSLSIFLAGVLGREVDPNHRLTPVLASLGQVIIVAVLWTPHLLLTLWAVILFRVMNRTAVHVLGVVDTVFATALTLWLGHRLSWVIAGAGAVVFIGDAVIDSSKVRHLLAGILSASWAVYLLIFDGLPWPGFVNYPVKIGLVSLISVTYLWAIYSERPIKPVEKVRSPRKRARLVQLVALGVGILFPLWTGSDGFHQIATFWSVLGSTSLVNVFSVL